MKIYNELESLGFFEWLSKTHNLKDTDMTPECLDKLLLEDIHRTVGNSMAFRWFREKYGYMSYIKGRQSMGFDYTLTDVPVNNRTKDTLFSPYMYDTYEEAELECLKKLIEIVKLK